MNQHSTSRVLCTAALPVACSSHLFLLAGPLPYPIVGALAAALGLSGLILRWAENRREDTIHVSPVYALLAALGALVGAFYASIIGPLILFFPKI